MRAKILSVGQCGLDEPRTFQSIRETLGAAVTVAQTADQARRTAAAGDYDLILINSALTDGTPGLELVSELAVLGGSATVMLVSDREDAQREAAARGAVRGFGKSELGSPGMIERLRRACAEAARSPCRAEPGYRAEVRS
jgi:DNA-binding NarL/FixJ family response regulator